jgi:hypothetical protein
MNHQDTDQVIKSVFGERPDDVLSPARRAGEVLDWLRAILFAIERTTDEYIVRSLASAGRYLASDADESINAQVERMENSLKKYRLENVR